MNALAPYFKAVVAFIAPGAVVITSSVLPGSDGGTFITQAEAITAACACILTAAGVYAVANRAAPAEPKPATDAPEHRAM